MYIISIQIKSREFEIPEVQELLTKYGKNINTRLGIHNLKENRQGIIILVYEAKDVEDFIEELNTINNIEINYMEV